MLAIQQAYNGGGWFCYSTIAIEDKSVAVIQTKALKSQTKQDNFIIYYLDGTN